MTSIERSGSGTKLNYLLCTSMINAHSSRGLHFRAFELYVQMLIQGVEPNAFTFSALLKSCLIKDGILLQAIKLGYDEDLFVRTRLLDVYARSGDVTSARQLFDTMPERSLVALTAMLVMQSMGIWMMRECCLMGWKRGMLCVGT